MAVTKYPRTEVEHPVRPYRIWVAKSPTKFHYQESAYLPHRHYVHELNAHRGAWLEAGWAPAGTVLEVIDARTGKLCGQYRVHPDNRVSFWR